MNQYKTKDNLLKFIYFAGILVPLSYYLSYKYFNRYVPINKLWGNIDKGLRTIYKYSMILTTLSFLAILFFIHFSVDSNTRVFGSKFNEGGFDYYFQPIALIILPSIIWMPITYLYLIEKNFLWRYAIVATLMTVALGGCLLMYAVENTKPKELINHHLRNRNIALVASKYLAFHLTVLDAIYWSYSFF